MRLDSCTRIWVETGIISTINTNITESMTDPAALAGYQQNCRVPSGTAPRTSSSSKRASPTVGMWH